MININYILQGKAKEESKKIGQKKIAKKKPFDDTDSDFEAAKALERDEVYYYKIMKWS